MRFLIIDDHPMLREGVAAVLRQLASEVEVLHAAHGSQGLEIAQAHPSLDAVLVDIRLVGMTGIEVVEQLHARDPNLPLIVLSSSEDPMDVRRALAAGALGYCPKSAGHATLLAAVRVVLSGEVYLPPFMLHAESVPAALEPLALSEPNKGITARQMEVLHLLCEGRPNKDIARRLAMQEKTVKAHVTAIFRALKVVNRVQAVAAAKAAGLIY
jgi:two-component system, NarL family, nitrate/nitrite response regulator NarL